MTCDKNDCHRDELLISIDHEPNFWAQSVTNTNHRQPRKALAVLMASAVVVLKHANPSTLRQRHNLHQLISNLEQVITLGRSSNLTKLVRVWRAVETPRGVNTYGYCFFLYSSTDLQPIPVNQFSRTIAQKTRSGVRKTPFWMRNV